MKWNKAIGWVLAAVAALCLLALPAHAGIIITEGKVASEGKSPDSKTSSGRRGTGKSSKDEPADDCGELDENGICIQTDETVEGVSLGGIEDLENDEPEGWVCNEVGGGLQYCEPATGSSPGAGAGGGLGAEASTGNGAEPMAGCQGGSGSQLWPALLVLLAALGLRRRQLAC